MQGVAGGVSARKLENGQAPIQYPDLLSASTTLVQSGSGYLRLVNALQTLDQAQNILAVIQSIQGQATAIATLQGQVTTLQGQIATANSNIATLQTEVAALQAQLDGVHFGAVGAAPTVLAAGLATTVGGTQYLLPLYSA